MPSNIIRNVPVSTIDAFLDGSAGISIVDIADGCCSGFVTIPRDAVLDALDRYVNTNVQSMYECGVISDEERDNYAHLLYAFSRDGMFLAEWMDIVNESDDSVKLVCFDTRGGSAEISIKYTSDDAADVYVCYF